ncbi:hypothetical protein KW782_00225 [Candidatus Parcubacteria bacterium]|nr:hypothetical protein [Candidatus Parcubacteria bacterium]
MPKHARTFVGPEELARKIRDRFIHAEIGHFCGYCGKEDDQKHHHSCPHDKPENSEEKKFWRRGFHEAYAGIPSKVSSPCYTLGRRQANEDRSMSTI